MSKPYATFTFEPSAHDEDDPERRNFRNALGHYPTGVTVVTALSESGDRVGLTVNSFTSISLHPPLILFAVGVNLRSAPAFRQGARFAVNLLGASQQEVAQRFARSHPDKFAGIAFRPGLGGVPLLDDTSGWLEAVVQDVHPSGDHRLVVGRVERFAHHADAEPLIYHKGRYRVFGG